MSWLDSGLGAESDLLSVALGESNIDLNSHDVLPDIGKNETTGNSSGLAGATLSLESTTTPNDLLNLAFLLSSTTTPNLPTTDDDILSFLEPFNEFKPASQHPAVLNQTSKTKEPETSLHLGGFNTTPSRINTSFFAESTLKDLLATGNETPSSLPKKVPNGLTNVYNNKEPTRKYVTLHNVFKINLLEKYCSFIKNLDSFINMVGMKF